MCYHKNAKADKLPKGWIMAWILPHGDTSPGNTSSQSSALAQMAA